MRTLIVYALLLIPFNVYCQYHEWTWMHGDSAKNSYGIYNIKGVSDPISHPGARYAQVNWQDTTNNFWIYGGGYYNFSPNSANNLWRYEPATNEWTWMHGADTTGNWARIYGVKGVANPANHPGSRGFGAASWSGKDNSLWLFGGESNDSRNDLWKYDIATNEWTWMHGDSVDGTLGVYGTKYIPDPNNFPRSRYETTATWVTSDGNLWLFGGSYNGNGVYHLNDLWRYDTGTNEWTWMHGSNTANPPAVYGTLGVPDSANTPSGRYAYASWIDSLDNLWLYGGYQIGLNQNGRSDMWRYSTTDGMWTWMSGAQTFNDSASFGIQCMEDSTSMPATGGEIRTNWTDDCGNMWLFGTTYVIPFQGTQCYNNLWRYNPNTGLWAWLYGDTAVYPVPDFGARGVSSPTNVPAATMGTISFNTDTAFWILGGMETLPSNYRHGALWKYIPDLVTADFMADTVCWGDTTTFTNLSVPNCNMIKGYYWTFGDPASGALNTSTDTIPTHVFTGAGTFNVKLVVQSCTFSWDSITLPVNVTLSSLVSAWGDTTIIAGDTVQLYAGSGTGYQWTPSTGLDCDTCQNPIANPTQNTTYQVTYTDSLGCIGTDNVTILIIQTHPPDTLPPPDTPSTGPCYLYVPNIFSPNGDGNNDVLYVRAPGYTLKTFVIYDRWGGKVFSTTDVSQGWDGTYRGKKVNTGVYVYYLEAICNSTGEEEVLKGNVSVVQ